MKWNHHLSEIHTKALMEIFITDLFIGTQNWEQPKCLNWELDKLWYVCGILFSTQKEWTIDICNTEGSQMYYAKGKKTDLTDYMPHDCIYMTWKRQNYRARKQVNPCQWLIVGRGFDYKGNVEGNCWEKRLLELFLFVGIISCCCCNKLITHLWLTTNLWPSMSEASSPKAKVLAGLYSFWRL